MKKVLKVLMWIGLVLSIILIFSARWLLTTWSDLSGDEIFYHLKTSISGTNEGMIWEYIRASMIPSAIVIAIIVAAFFFIKKKFPKHKKKTFIILGVIAILNIAVTITILEVKTGILRYMIRNATMSDSVDDDFIYKNYVDPKNVEMKFPEKKRNLIFIFLESMETTYASTGDGGGFEQGCIPELVQIAKENEDFSGSSDQLNGGVVLPGATWTMGAMFGQSSGLPLQVPVGGNTMGREDEFFPSVTALGDILQKEGYNQVLMLGSNATFGGRDSYYLKHGNYEIRDYQWALDNKKIPDGYKVWWGFEDEKLIDIAKETLGELSSKSEPFNLTMLTVDTHFSDGYVCRLCGDEFGDNQYANVMACNSRQIKAFLEWIKTQDFYENTTIILSGDHTTMDADFCENVSSDYQRKTFTAIINGAPAENNAPEDRVFSTFDMFPTTLAALGVTIPGNQLGLGVNLYSDKTTLVEKYGISECTSELSVPSPFMNQLSGVTLKPEHLDALYNRAKVWVGRDKKSKCVWVYIDEFDDLNYSALKSAELEVKDTVTGEVKNYDMTATQTNVNRFHVDVVTDIPSSKQKIKELEMTLYFTVEGVEHYPVLKIVGGKKTKVK